MTSAARDSTPAFGWIPNSTTFGARLALLRQAMGWGNIKEAASACSQPVESWRNWERDGRQPRNLVQIVRQISDATGADYYWLLDGSTFADAQANEHAKPESPRRPKSAGASRGAVVAGTGFEPVTSGL